MRGGIRGGDCGRGVGVGVSGFDGVSGSVNRCGRVPGERNGVARSGVSHAGLKGELVGELVGRGAVELVGAGRGIGCCQTCGTVRGTLTAGGCGVGRGAGAAGGCGFSSSVSPGRSSGRGRMRGRRVGPRCEPGGRPRIVSVLLVGVG